MNTDEINVLLERAGCEKVPVTVRVWNFDSRHGLGRQVESLQNTLMLCSKHRQALAAALEKVLAERDAMVADMRGCYMCKNSGLPEEDEPCRECCAQNGFKNFEWRGVQPKEE